MVAFHISSESFKLIEVVNTTRVCGAHHTFNHIHTVVYDFLVVMSQSDIFDCPIYVFEVMYN